MPRQHDLVRRGAADRNPLRGLDWENIDEAAREVFDDVLRTVLVVRGDEPRAPREMLPLHMPTAAKGATPAGDESEAALAEPDGDDLKPFERGPEITEVR